jgi:hypothetical protein
VNLLFLRFYHAATLITTGTVFGGKVTPSPQHTPPQTLPPPHTTGRKKKKILSLYLDFGYIVATVLIIT